MLCPLPPTRKSCKPHTPSALSPHASSLAQQHIHLFQRQSTHFISQAEDFGDREHQRCVNPEGSKFKPPGRCKASTRCSLRASTFPFAQCLAYPTTPQGSKCLLLSYFVSHLCMFLYSAFILVPPSILVPYITLTAWPRAGGGIYCSFPSFRLPAHCLELYTITNPSCAVGATHAHHSLCCHVCFSHSHIHTHTLSLSLSLSLLLSAGSCVINNRQSTTPIFALSFLPILSNSCTDYLSAIKWR